MKSGGRAGRPDIKVKTPSSPVPAQPAEPGPGRRKSGAGPFRGFETDLYPPLKAWLEEAGYLVRAEVGGCDVAACKGGDLVLIEIKRAINLDLLLQVVRRQEAEAAVYAAVPAPRTVDKRWRGLTRLLKRLEVGLLLVYLESARPRVELAFHPVRQEPRRRKQAARALLTEISGRSRDLNVGGSVRQKIMTAYREEALGVAAALDRLGPTSPKTLRAAGTSVKTGRILFDNHYGWYERLAKGVYQLSESGREALSQHPELVAGLLAGLKF